MCDRSANRRLQHFERVAVGWWRVLEVAVVLWFGVEAGRRVEVDQPAPLPFATLTYDSRTCRLTRRATRARRSAEAAPPRRGADGPVVARRVTTQPSRAASPAFEKGDDRRAMTSTLDTTTGVA